MTTRKEYRVGGGHNYVIDYVPQSNGTIQINAPLHPPDRHGKGVHHHHLYPSGNVCVSAGREPHTMSEAAKIAKSWMEGWSDYVRTGSFPGS